MDITDRSAKSTAIIPQRTKNQEYLNAVGFSILKEALMSRIWKSLGRMVFYDQKHDVRATPHANFIYDWGIVIETSIPIAPMCRFSEFT